MGKSMGKSSAVEHHGTWAVRARSAGHVDMYIDVDRDSVTVENMPWQIVGSRVRRGDDRPMFCFSLTSHHWGWSCHLHPSVPGQITFSLRFFWAATVGARNGGASNTDLHTDLDEDQDVGDSHY